MSVPAVFQKQAIDLLGAMRSPAAKTLARELAEGGAEDGGAIVRAALRTAAASPRVQRGVDEFCELMLKLASTHSKDGSP